MSDINKVLDNAKISMEKAIEHLESELQKVLGDKTGKLIASYLSALKN